MRTETTTPQTRQKPTAKKPAAKKKKPSVKLPKVNPKDFNLETLKKLNKKQRMKLRTVVDVIIRLLFFLLLPGIFSTAFSGVKYLFQQMQDGKPFEMNAFITTLILVCVFTIVFGRFFCGFACSFGTYGDFVYWVSTKVRKKLRKRPFAFSVSLGNKLRYIKYVVLVLILLLCVFGQADFIAVNSPWSVFSRLQSLKLPQSIGLGLLLLVLITVGMVFERRFFCRFLCPMGAVFSLLPVLPFSAVQRDRQNCINGCHACQIRCPANLEIAITRDGDSLPMGECFSCGNCMEICPRGNVHTDGLMAKYNGLHWIILQIIRALVLLILCFIIGV